jgi:lipopolysaccharide heptosyltransferase I
MTDHALKMTDHACNVTDHALKMTDHARNMADQALKMADHARNVTDHAFSVAAKAFTVVAKAFTASVHAFTATIHAFTTSVHAFTTTIHLVIASITGRATRTRADRASLLGSHRSAQSSGLVARRFPSSLLRFLAPSLPPAPLLYHVPLMGTLPSPSTLPPGAPAAHRILIIRPSALGDVARSVPVLASLRAAYPQARIDWLVRDIFAPVIEAHPALSNVIIFPRSDFSRWFKTFNLAALRAYLATLAQPGYDLVFDCQGLARSGLLAWATKAPVRVGTRDARECAWLAYTHRIKTPKVIHTVDKSLALLGALHIPVARDAAARQLYSSPAARAWLAAQPFANSPSSSTRYAVLSPTSAWPAKQWPADRFAQLAQHLTSRNITCIITGGGKERPQVQPLLDLASRNPRVIDLMGATDVAQLMAVIEGAALVVANDSAALHIGVGFDRPCVGLLGPTDPKLASPFGREGDIVQHVGPGDEFYFRDARSAGMMQRITLEEVIAACEKRLDNRH